MSAKWLGNHQVYGWSRYHMNTVQMVTCALMAMEKWLEELIEKKEAITPYVQMLFQEGRSLAFAGVFNSFREAAPRAADEPKPLLFPQELYMLDMTASREMTGVGTGRAGQSLSIIFGVNGKTLPAGERGLLEIAREWFLLEMILSRSLTEVWANALSLPDKSEEQLACSAGLRTLIPPIEGGGTPGRL